ncbi:MAG TPA: GNAT family N-acetyltransferase [Anaerolineales bacterium]|nr:GNAT family N-acetyltransferase [Anaerolineales bacterium]
MCPASRKPTVHRLDPTRRDDFSRLHSEANGCGVCQCVAWWTPSWDGWGERTAEQNRALRQSLFEDGQDDGYLLYLESEPIGWVQVGPRDRLTKLVAEYRLPSAEHVWAATCFLLAPHARGRGWARLLLQEVVRDLPGRGARVLEAYPRRGLGLDAGAVWTGPEALFVDLGFTLVQEHPRRPRYRLSLETANP